MKPHEPLLAQDLENLHTDTRQPIARSSRAPGARGCVTELMKGNQVTGMTVEEERGSQKNPQQESCKRKLNQVFSHGGDLYSHLHCCYSKRKETQPQDSQMDKVTHHRRARPALLKPRANFSED